MLDRIIESTREHWEELWPGSSPPKDLRYILQSRKRVILFLFDAQKKGGKLVGVVKISRHVKGNDRLERSVRLLGEVRKQLDGYILETVPKAIMLDPICGLSASLEQALPGEPIFLGHTPWAAARRARRDWQAWRQWLVEFQKQAVVGSGTVSARTIDEAIMSHMEIVLEHDPATSRVIGDLQVITKELDGLVMNTVWCYGDAHHSNVLIDKSRVSGVVDWEGVEAGHWPISDWFQFAFQYLVDLYRVRSAKASHGELGMRAIDLLLGSADCSLAAVIQEQTRAFLAAWEVEASALPAILVAFLAQFHWPWGKGALLKHAHAILCE